MLKMQMKENMQGHGGLSLHKGVWWWLAVPSCRLNFPIIVPSWLGPFLSRLHLSFVYSVYLLKHTMCTMYILLKHVTMC